MKDLKREAYQKLLAWKQRPDHKTLEVSGARQVGKTYLVNKFADEQYAHKVYVNLLEFSGEVFLEDYHEIQKEMREGKRFRNPVKELLMKYEPEFTDTKDTVVIIDEIQESAEIYNRIREFTRSLQSEQRENSNGSIGKRYGRLSVDGERKYTWRDSGSGLYNSCIWYFQVSILGTCYCTGESG